jgi:hypothetical protein
MFRKTTFDDFYGPGNTNIKEYTGTKYTGRIATTDQNVYVHDCFFQSCSSSSDGGALNCGSTIYKLLVDQASFISCRTSSTKGGAILFESTTNGQCILSRVCGFDCSSTHTGSNSWGQFVYMTVKNDVTFKNYVNDSSFTHSSNTIIDSYEALRPQYGSVLWPSVNITNNVCYYFTAFLCHPTTGTGSPVSETFCISFSSFVNNTADNNNVMYHTNSASSHRIDTCNIIGNKQTGSSGIIYSSANLHIKDSCIIGNENRVFYASSKTITISNCTIDDDIFTSGRCYGSVTVNKTISKSFINALSHIATQRCDSYFDSYGTLTVEPKVPSRTIRCLISFNCKYQTNDLIRYMQLIFLLTFLPSDPVNGDYFHFNFLL